MQLWTVTNPNSNPSTRCYIDGKRVSRAAYNHEIYLAGLHHKHYECFLTKCKHLKGGNFKRWNYSYIN
jgi:hypothetical protein